MRSSSASSNQERRCRQLGLIDGHEENGKHDQLADAQHNSNYFRKPAAARDGKEKQALVIIKPFKLKTLVLVSLLFATAILTVTFPIASFESEPDLVAAAQQQWSSGSRRARQMIKMWEHFQEEKKIKKVVAKQENKSSIRSKLSYWEELMSILESLANDATSGQLRLGIINYNNGIGNELEDDLWGSLTSMDIVPHLLGLEQANKSLAWKHLYPEWIDEEEVFEVPKCPSLPMPKLEMDTKLDVVFVEVACNKSSDWARDVLRLHLHLGVANVAVNSNSSFVVLYSKCPPIPNLFTCKDLVMKSGDLWLYAVDLPKLKKKLTIPVGSCELTVPLKANESTERIHRTMEVRREAYATILHSADIYVCGAIALAQSIRRTGSTRDMVILVDNNIQQENRQGLEEAGWIVEEIQRIRNPRAEPDSYNEWNYSKLRLWQLTTYHKLIFLDSDVLVLRNIDFLFDSEEISASGNSRTVFNSGVMVLEPNECMFELLMSNIEEIFSYNGGDQGFLNEIFTWWHRLPKRMNFLKHFYSNSQEEFEEKTRLFGMHPPQLYVLHFLGYKPWLCFRDYDCNWHYPELRNFASDVAHATWWELHDTMSQSLQRFCHLSLNQTATLVADMIASQLSPIPDPYLHWQRNISDPRFLHPIEYY